MLMKDVLKGLVLTLRFLVELVVFLGLPASIFLDIPLYQKGFFLAMGICFIIIWSQFGSPRAPKRLEGKSRIILESLVVGLTTLALPFIYGLVFALSFGLVALMDTVLIHLLNLDAY